MSTAKTDAATSHGGGWKCQTRHTCIMFRHPSRIRSNTSHSENKLMSQSWSATVLSLEMMWDDTNTHTDTAAACIWDLDWRLTPVKALIRSKVWSSNCALPLWSEEAREARLVLRDSQVATHTSGVKKDFRSRVKEGEQTGASGLSLTLSWHLQMCDLGASYNPKKGWEFICICMCRL